jgi:hypothetical protein
MEFPIFWPSTILAFKFFFLSAYKFVDIGTFGDIGHFRRYGNKYKFFVQKMKNVVFGNHVISQTIFQFYKEFHDRFEWRESPKCVEFNSPLKRN